MSDQSLLEEMRAAVRGDRERAEQRRATPLVPERPVENPPAEPKPPDPVVAPAAKPGLARRLLRRQ